MSKHEELTNSLRASAAAMPSDAAVAVQYRAAADALEAQAREIERLRQDAARYRWLREHSLAAGQGSITVELDDRANGNFSRPIFLAELDAAIDAARAAQEDKSHGLKT